MNVDQISFIIWLFMKEEVIGFQLLQAYCWISCSATSGNSSNFLEDIEVLFHSDSTAYRAIVMRKCVDSVRQQRTAFALLFDRILLWNFGLNFWSSRLPFWETPNPGKIPTYQSGLWMSWCLFVLCFHYKERIHMVFSQVLGSFAPVAFFDDVLSI